MHLQSFLSWLFLTSEPQEIRTFHYGADEVGDELQLQVKEI